MPLVTAGNRCNTALAASPSPLPMSVEEWLPAPPDRGNRRTIPSAGTALPSLGATGVLEDVTESAGLAWHPLAVMLIAPLIVQSPRTKTNSPRQRLATVSVAPAATVSVLYCRTTASPSWVEASEVFAGMVTSPSDPSPNTPPTEFLSNP